MNDVAASPYKFTISLNILNHLGPHLYSNVPAVLSEAVANAWDADATRVEVKIDLKKDRVEIDDDGEGMTEADINNRYLKVGHQRRQEGYALSPSSRKVMGRKGIGSCRYSQ